MAKRNVPSARDDIRQTILLAALEVFCQKGYGSTTLVDIAKKAKLSKQRVHYHCKDVNQILIELTYQWGETGRLVTMEYLAAGIFALPQDKIIGICEGMFLWMRKYPKYAKLSPVMFQAVVNNSEIKQLFRETLSLGIKRIGVFLKQMPKFSRHSPEKLHESAQGIHSVMVGTALYVVGQDLWSEIDAFEKVAVNAIQAILEK